LAVQYISLCSLRSLWPVVDLEATSEQASSAQQSEFIKAPKIALHEKVLIDAFIFGGGVTFYILLAYLAGFPIAKILVSRSARYQQIAEDLKKKGYASVGGFTIGGAGGGWSSRGSSGGGFSGGGGSSGGGGASGSW